MADQSRSGGFAIGSRNGNDTRPRTRHFPLEHFRVANDFNADGLGLHHRPVRLRMGERHAGTQDKTVKRSEINVMQIRNGKICLLRRSHRRFRVIPGKNFSPAEPQGFGASQARARQAEERYFLVFE